MKKKLVFLIFALLVGTFALAVAQAELLRGPAGGAISDWVFVNDPKYNGGAGYYTSTVDYILNTETGDMWITGNGEMDLLFESNCSFHPDIKNVYISSGITSVMGFERCKNLTTVTIPSTVTRIEWGTFQECSNLTTVTWPSSVEIIESKTFLNCENLKEFVIPAGVKEIQEDAFSGCSSLKEINIPSSVKIIEDRAFQSCSSLTKIDIPDTTALEGGYWLSSGTFSGCSSLKEVHLPSNLTFVHSSMFSGCSSLTNIDIPAGVTEIGDSAFVGSGLTQIDIPASVSIIGNSAFRLCDSLKEIAIPTGVKIIGYETFAHCSSLSKVEIPSGVELISARAFQDCASLEQITIPSTVTDIQTLAFDGCPEHLTFCCEYGSYAFNYAIEHGFRVSIIGNDPRELAITLSSEQNGSAINTLIYNTRYFWPSENSNSKQFWLDVTADVVDLLAINETITLPAGLSFSEDSDQRTMDITLGGHRSSKVSEGYQVYARECEQDVQSVKITAEGDKSYAKTIQVKTVVPEIEKITVSSTEYGEAIDTVLLIDGVLRSSMDPYANNLWLNITVKNVGGPEIHENVSLPLGLEMSYGWNNPIIFGGKGEIRDTVRIQLDSTQLTGTPPTSVQFSLKGDLKKTLTLPVQVVKTIKLSLYDTQTDAESGSAKISTLYNCDGNFATNVEGDGTFFLRVESEFVTTNIQSIDLQLPQGLTFSRNSASSSDRKKTVKLGGDLKSIVEIIPVYVVYKKQSVESLTITADNGSDTEKLNVIVKSREPVIRFTHDTNISKAREDYERKISVNWNELYGSSVPTGYRDSLADLGSMLSMSVYDRNNIKSSLYFLGFHDIKYYPDGGSRFGSDYCIGVKPIPNPTTGTVTQLVAVVVRGTIGVEEWIGNLIVGKGETPKSFDDATNNVIKKLEIYLADRDLTANNVAVYTCGHSRGGAIANIAVRRLTDKGVYKGVTGYTIATPNTTRVDTASREQYNVYNFKYYYDVVPYVPQTYYNFGKTYVFGNVNDRNVPQSVREKYYSFTKEDYNIVQSKITSIWPAIQLGEKTNNLPEWAKVKLANLVQWTLDTGYFQDNTHSGENYISWITTRHRSDCITYERALSLQGTKLNKKLPITSALRVIGIDDRVSIETAMFMDVLVQLCSVKDITLAAETEMYRRSQLLVVQCPVNVTLCNKKGEAVAVVKNHVVKSWKDDSVVVYAEGDTDLFVVPADKGYYLDITGNNKGTMTVSIASIDEKLQTTDTSVFADVPVEKKEGFTFTPKWSDADKSKLVSDSGETYLPTLPENVTIPGAMTKLPNNAFAGNAALTGRVVIPENITEIGSKAFKGTKITEVLLPKNVKKISKHAFDGMVSDVLFRCYKDSYAEKWLKEKGLKYEYR